MRNREHMIGALVTLCRDMGAEAEDLARLESDLKRLTHTELAARYGTETRDDPAVNEMVSPADALAAH